MNGPMLPVPLNLPNSSTPKERAALYRQFPVHRTVVDGTQVPHVIGGAVRTYPLVLQPCLVFQHEGGADILQRDVAVPAPKVREAVQNWRIRK